MKSARVTVGETAGETGKSGLSGGDDFCDCFVSDRSIGHVARNVPEYLERLERAADVRSGDIVAWMNQVHGTSICHVGRDHEHQISVKVIDGMWTDQKGVILVAKTADCAPLMMWSREAGVVAALHCGWKGHFDGILEAFAAICEERGFRMASFSAFIGPMLRESNFEVQQDFIDKIPGTQLPFLVQRGERYTFDLNKAIHATLRKLGVSDIEDCGIDTFTSADYYSYRKWTQTPKPERSENYKTFASGIVMR